MVQKKKLKNGLTILYKKKDTDSVTIEISVKTGCIYEPDNLMGVSHFIEHMLFNGTKNRSQSSILNTIENLGGEMNAATTNDRTFYYIKIFKRHFDIALEIISDMILNSNFPSKLFNREKKIVLDEINMVYDNPRHYQFILFHKALFKNHPCQKNILGTKETINNLTRQDMIDYYKKLYTPDNMIISIVGNIEKPFESVEKIFNNIKSKPITLPKIKKIETKKNILINKRKIAQSYLVMGYSVPSRTFKEAYILDIIRTILGRGQSGWIFDEVRNKKGLAYDIGVYNESSIDYGFFSIYVNSHKENFEKIKSIIFKQFKRLETLTKKELENAITNLEGNHILEHEDTQEMADELAFLETCHKAELFDDYINFIKKITLKQVKDTAKKYLTKDYAEAMIIQE